MTQDECRNAMIALNRTLRQHTRNPREGIDVIANFLAYFLKRYAVPGYSLDDIFETLEAQIRGAMEQNDDHITTN